MKSVALCSDRAKGSGRDRKVDVGPGVSAPSIRQSQIVCPAKRRVGIRPGVNHGADGWFLQSTPIQMPPRRGGI